MKTFQTAGKDSIPLVVDTISQAKAYFQTKTAAQRKRVIKTMLKAVENSRVVECGRAREFLENRPGHRVFGWLETSELKEILNEAAKVVFVTSESRLTSPDPHENTIDYFYQVVICDQNGQWIILTYFVGCGPGGTWEDEPEHLVEVKRVDIDDVVRFVEKEYPALLRNSLCQNLSSQGIDLWWL